MILGKRNFGVSVDEVVDSYWKFLYRNNYSIHLDKFKQRLQSDQKAAEAEAVVFSLLWSAKVRPDIFEDPGTGGLISVVVHLPGTSFLSK